MLRQLTAEQVHAALPWDALASALSRAFQTPSAAPPRHAHTLANAVAPDREGHLLLMPAWDEAAIGLKVVTVLPEAVQHGGRTVGATYLLLDRQTGALCALLDGDALTVRRTAATSALAARALANSDPRTLLLVGTGHLAPWMARAHVALQPSIRRVLVWGRNATRVQHLVAELASEGLPAEAAQELARDVHGADIVSCATTSATPIVQGAWLAPGTHLDLVGGYTRAMREADDVAIARARVVVDTYSGALAEAGDVTQPIERGVITRGDIVAELGEVLRGERAGRRSPQDITCFKSVGHALEDLAAAHCALWTDGRA